MHAALVGPPGMVPDLLSVMREVPMPSEVSQRRGSPSPLSITPVMSCVLQPLTFLLANVKPLPCLGDDTSKKNVEVALENHASKASLLLSAAEGGNRDVFNEILGHELGERVSTCYAVNFHLPQFV